MSRKKINQICYGNRIQQLIHPFCGQHIRVAGINTRVS